MQEPPTDGASALDRKRCLTLQSASPHHHRGRSSHGLPGIIITIPCSMLLPVALGLEEVGGLEPQVSAVLTDDPPPHDIHAPRHPSATRPGTSTDGQGREGRTESPKKLSVLPSVRNPRSLRACSSSHSGCQPPLRSLPVVVAMTALTCTTQAA